LCEKEPTIPLFMKPEWLDAVCEKSLTWDVVLVKNKEEKVEGALVFCKKKKYGFTQITMPPFTQFTGFWFSEKNVQDIDNQRVIVEKLLQKLPLVHRCMLRFAYNFRDISVLRNNDFEEVMLHTQVIENLNHAEDLHSNLSRDVQRNIKKANQSFQIEVKDDFDTFYRLANNVYDRQKSLNPVPLSIWQSVHRLIHEKGWGRVYQALDEANEAHAAVMVVWDAKTKYVLASGSTDKGRKNGAMTLLIWQAILDSIGKYEIFNFLGSMIPAIEVFNARFNAQKKYYFKVEKYQNKLLKLIWRLLKK
jgi:hypothetical protein